MAFFKECLSCEGDDSSYFKDPNSEMQAEWTKRNDIIVSIYAKPSGGLYAVFPERKCRGEGRFRLR